MSNKLYIYNFHRISDDYSPAYPPIPLRVFEKIINNLNKKYLIIPQEALLQKESFNTKKDLLILSFDDAFLDFYQNALPILNKKKIPAVQHVITQCAQNGETFWTQKLNQIIEICYKRQIPLSIEELNYFNKNLTCYNVGKTALEIYKMLLNNKNRNFIISNILQNLNINIENTPMMNWEHLKEIANFKISIGSHTHSHDNLKYLNDEEILYELTYSKQLILKNIGIEPISIAYPNSQYNSNVFNISKDIGYKILYISGNKFNNIDNYNYLFCRINLYHTKYWKNWIKMHIY